MLIFIVVKTLKNDIFIKNIYNLYIFYIFVLIIIITVKLLQAISWNPKEQQPTVSVNKSLTIYTRLYIRLYIRLHIRLYNCIFKIVYFI